MKVVLKHFQLKEKIVYSLIFQYFDRNFIISYILYMSIYGQITQKRHIWIFLPKIYLLAQKIRINQ